MLAMSNTEAFVLLCVVGDAVNLCFNPSFGLSHRATSVMKVLKPTCCIRVRTLTANAPSVGFGLLHETTHDRIHFECKLSHPLDDKCSQTAV